MGDYPSALSMVIYRDCRINQLSVADFIRCANTGITSSVRKTSDSFVKGSYFVGMEIY